MASSDVKGLPVRDVMGEPILIPPNLKISKVIGVLKDQGVYEVFTQIADKVGMISMRGLLKVTSIVNQKASSTMIYVPKLSPETRISEAADIMAKYRVRALPVVERRKVTGQINATAIVRILNPEQLKDLKINSIMTGGPIVAESEDSAAKVRSIMVRRRIDHVPVVADGKLRGMVTSSDIVFRMYPSDAVERGALGSEKQVRLDFAVSRIMDTHPVTCGVEDRVSTVLREVMRSRSTYAVALLWDEVQGIVTYRDFLKLIAAERGMTDIPVYIVGLPDDAFEAEAARDKFVRTVRALRKTFPEIIEARSTVKTRDVGEERKRRRRYEVKAMLRTPYKTFSYGKEGYDLPSIYDEISDRMKRLIAQKPKRIREPSLPRREELPPS